jgi:hypothetical protein
MSRGKWKPLPLSSPAGWRGKKEEEEKNLTAPLTFILSRRGREEMKKYPLTLALSRGVERGEKGREGNKKEFT